MSRSRAVRYLLCFVLFFGMLGGLVGDRVVLAARESSNSPLLLPLNQEQSPPGDKLELTCRYPALRDIAGRSFEFEVGLKWLGSEARKFELAIMVPPKWIAAIFPGYGEKEIREIGLESGKEYPETVKVRFAPSWDYLPEPGDYIVTLEASSGGIRETIELKAVVTAQYRCALYTASGRLNVKVTAGEDNHLSLELLNSGTAPIENVSLLSSKPSGWDVTFNPDKVESLGPNLVQEIDVVIKPPRKTIAGDYALEMKAVSQKVGDDLELRVTVLTPTIWGWVGILIVLAVIAGLAVVFRRLGRR